MFLGSWHVSVSDTMKTFGDYCNVRVGPRSAALRLVPESLSVDSFVNIQQHRPRLYLSGTLSVRRPLSPAAGRSQCGAAEAIVTVMARRRTEAGRGAGGGQ